MQKRGLILSTLILIVSINFASAQYGIGDMLDAFGGENLLLVGSFVISFTLIYFILGRLSLFKSKSKEYPYEEKRNKAVPAIIAFIISLFIIYGINRYDIDLADVFSDYLGEGILTLIAMIAIIVALIYLFKKFKSYVLLALGLLLIGISLTDWVYESGTLFIVGVILIIIWILIKIFGRPKKPKTPEELEADREKQIRKEEDYKRRLEELEERRRIERSRTAQRLLDQRARRKGAEQEKLEALRREQGALRQKQELEERRKMERGRTAQKLTEERRRRQEAERQKQLSEERIREKRRSLYDLKQKYLAYLFQYHIVLRQKKFDKAKRMKQAMITIIQYAEKLGCSKKVFLSKEIAGNNAKAPEELS